MPIVLMALLAVGIVVGFLVASPSAPAVQPGQQTETGTGAEEIVPPVDENPPAQIEPEVVAPTAPVKEWPKVEVVWQEVPPTPGVYLLNPIEDDGFYTGTMNTPNGFTSTYEGLAYLKTHFPQIEKAVMVAAMRDDTDKNVVFVSIVTLIDHPYYLFLSLDGEKSWYELNLAPVDATVAGSHAVRVKTEGDLIRLIARDNVVGEKWWGTTIKRSDLQAP
jgi:hypothetical protein